MGWRRCRPDLSRGTSVSLAKSCLLVFLLKLVLKIIVRKIRYYSASPPHNIPAEYAPSYLVKGTFFIKYYFPRSRIVPSCLRHTTRYLLCLSFVNIVPSFLVIAVSSFPCLSSLYRTFVNATSCPPLTLRSGLHGS